MKFNNHDIKVVWLDLDDTIIDFLSNSRAALERLWREEPTVHDLFATPDNWVEVYERHNHALWDEYARGTITRPYLRLQRFLRPLLEGGATPDCALEAARRYDTLYLDFLADERRLLPGAIRLLQVLRKAGVTVGCLSNGFREVQYRKITNCGLDPYFDLVVLSDDIDVTKPDIRLFRYAMERAGHDIPGEHLMVGDNADTDIAGAISAGWQAIQLLRTPQSRPSTQTPFITDSLDKIAGMLAVEANDSAR